MDEKIARTIDALNRHRFKAGYAQDKDECLQQLLKLIPVSAAVGVPGSATVRATGVVEALRERGQTVYDHWGKELSRGQALQVRHRQLQCDLLLTSANAVTETGEILNMDGIGNRVAATIFGPGRVVIVAGRNKIVPTLSAGRKRIMNIAAPKRARELEIKTPCAQTGVCSNCDVPDRICRVEVILHRAPSLTPIAVIVVDEDLGN
jgi:hypothetical protein